MRSVYVKLLQFCLCLVVAFFAWPVWGGPPNLYGQINMASGDPLGNAQVELILADGSVVEKATTDKTGVFACYELKPGQYQLRISYAGKPCLIRQADKKVETVEVLVVAGVSTKGPDLVVEIP